MIFKRNLVFVIHFNRYHYFISKTLSSKKTFDNADEKYIIHFMDLFVVFKFYQKKTFDNTVEKHTVPFKCLLVFFLGQPLGTDLVENLNDFLGTRPILDSKVLLDRAYQYIYLKICFRGQTPRVDS